VLTEATKERELLENMLKKKKSYALIEVTRARKAHADCTDANWTDRPPTAQSWTARQNIRRF